MSERPDRSAALVLHRQVFVDHLDTPSSARVLRVLLDLLVPLGLLPAALLVKQSLLPAALLVASQSVEANNSDLVHRLPQCDAPGRLCFG